MCVSPVYDNDHRLSIFLSKVADRTVFGARTYRVELPLTAVSVYLAKDHSSHAAVILGEVISEHLLTSHDALLSGSQSEDRQSCS